MTHRQVGIFWGGKEGVSGSLSGEQREGSPGSLCPESLKLGPSPDLCTTF